MAKGIFPFKVKIKTIFYLQSTIQLFRTCEAILKAPLQLLKLLFKTPVLTKEFTALCLMVTGLFQFVLFHLVL